MTKPVAVCTDSTNWFVKMAFVLVWTPTVVIGFVALMIWSGLMVGWNVANEILERND